MQKQRKKINEKNCLISDYEQFYKYFTRISLNLFNNNLGKLKMENK